MVIGQSKAFAAKLSFEDAVFFSKIVDDVLLVPLDPARDGDDKEVPRVKCAHAGRW